MIPVHDLSASPKKEIRVVELSSLTKYDFGVPHRHNYFEFFIFLKGGGSHNIDFVDFPIYPNSIHIVAPGQIHQVKRDVDSYGFVLLFEKDVFSNHNAINDFLFDHICLGVQEHSPVYRFNQETEERIIKIALEIWEDHQSGHGFRNEFAITCFALLYLYCMRTKPLNPEKTISKKDLVYLQFRRLLYQNFKEVKLVKGYSKALNITEKQLNEISNYKSGHSASFHIYSQIILEAKRLLNSGLSAKESAYELKFDDPAHFSKFFKSKTGVPPSEYQKIQAKG